MSFTIVIGVMLLWILGGQIHKGFRRYGISGGASLIVLWKVLGARVKGKEVLKTLATIGFLLTLIAVFSLGYGVDSWLIKRLKKEWLVRVVYGLLVGFPFSIWFMFYKFSWGAVVGCPLSLMGVFSLHLSSVKVKDFEILFEDVLRGLVIGGWMWILLR